MHLLPQLGVAERPQAAEQPVDGEGRRRQRERHQHAHGHALGQERTRKVGVGEQPGEITDAEDTGHAKVNGVCGRHESYASCARRRPGVGRRSGFTQPTMCWTRSWKTEVFSS